MFYKSPFGKQNQRAPKQLQQLKAPEKLTQQMRLKIHEKMQEQKQLQTPSYTSSTKYNKFYITLQDVVDQNNTQTAWISPTLIPISNQKTRNLFIKKQSYLISNYYGADYPRKFWIVAPGINGYLNSTGGVTNKVACMTLVNISSNVDESGQKFLDLLYSQQDQVTWPIPVGGLTFTFEIQLDDDSYLQMPLTNGLSINFEIRQIGL